MRERCNTEKVRIGAVTSVYTAILILSSPFGRACYNSVVDALGRTVVSLLIWALFLFGATVIIRSLKGTRSSSKWRVIAALACGLGYAATFDIMEERMHLFLFGVLGWLVVQDNQKLSAGWAIGLAAMIGLIVGAIDEGVQAITPDRIGDWRDVVFNIVGALWGAVLRVSHTLRDNRDI